MMRTRIKICGVMTPEIAACAAHCGADAIGLMGYEHSARYIDIDQALAVRRVLPAFVASVAVWVNPAAELVREMVARVGVDLLQFHGDEPRDFCAGFGKPYIKGIRVDENTDIAAQIADYEDAAAILLDSRVADHYGGTGVCFDWALAKARNTRPLIVAGGITAANAAQAISQVRPYALDVSSGVETNGVKDENKIRAFCRAVMAAG